MFSPTSEEDLARIVAEAEAPLSIRGGGTRPIGAPVNGRPLTTRAIAGIELYEPGALTLVAKAGTPVAEIEAALAAEGQRLAFEPMDHRVLLSSEGTPTIGGVVAANVSGPRRIQVGAARDFLLGVRFVDGRGQVIRNGGRVMKNVTGYDLVKLMAGSHGTLGILSEVALKVLPAPEATGGLRISGLCDEDAVAALSRALGSPYEVTGAAHLRKAGPGGGPVTMIRLEGAGASVEYRAKALRDLLKSFGEIAIEATVDRPDRRDRAGRTDADWQDVRDVAPFQDRPGDVWRLSVKASDAPGLVASLDGVEALYDWGGGLVWLLAPPETAGPIRKAVAMTGGHATLIRGDRTGGVFQPLSPTVAALQDGLRQRFDPRGILNPGLMTRAA